MSKPTIAARFYLASLGLCLLAACVPLEYDVSEKNEPRYKGLIGKVVHPTYPACLTRFPEYEYFIEPVQFWPAADLSNGCLQSNPGVFYSDANANLTLLDTTSVVRIVDVRKPGPFSIQDFWNPSKRSVIGEALLDGKLIRFEYVFFQHRNDPPKALPFSGVEGDLTMTNHAKLPVVETVQGRVSMVPVHPMTAGPIPKLDTGLPRKEISPSGECLWIVAEGDLLIAKPCEDMEFEER